MSLLCDNHGQAELEIRSQRKSIVWWYSDELPSLGVNNPRTRRRQCGLAADFIHVDSRSIRLRSTYNTDEIERESKLSASFSGKPAEIARYGER